MKKLRFVWVVLAAVAIVGCSSSTSSEVEFVEASDEKQFVWNAMNFWYYWQGDVTQLGDDYFSDDEEFNNYLRDFPNAEEVFYSLLHNEDDFSFFIDDFEEFNQSQEGISESFGYEYGLVRIEDGQPEIFGYVQYVLDGGPAQEAGLVRGDIFTSVDGTQLTVNNYQDLLFGTTSYEITLAVIENGEIQETDETVSLQAETLTEDPIYHTTVFDTSNTKVGYLMYNAFQTNSHEDLNNIVGNFENEGIDELVIDLRYNGGGAGVTSQTLASMVAGLDSSNVFSRYTYNEKRAEINDLNRSIYFTEELPIYEDGDRTGSGSLNTLSMDRVYVLTGFGTASASEVLINGLEPYIDVVLIGRQTVGKDEGSYTLYDAPSPYLDEENANPDHKIAIQPIALKVVNVDGREYPDGFVPDEELREVSYLEDGLAPLGDPNELLLGKAIEMITGQQQNAKMQQTPLNVGEPFKDSKDLKPYAKGLYLETKPLKEASFK